MVFRQIYLCKISNKHTPKRCFQTKKSLKIQNKKKKQNTHTKNKTKKQKTKKEYLPAASGSVVLHSTSNLAEENNLQWCADFSGSILHMEITYVMLHHGKQTTFMR